MKASFLLIFFLVACSCGEEPSVITTPNGRRGIYCTGIESSGRTGCYLFVSKNCPGGYTFLRESDNALLIECKKQEPGQ